jgi:hypothetical protein
MLELEMIYGELKEGEKYKPLPLVIDKHQHRYTQLFRKGRIAIYQQSYRPYSGFENISNHYEVIIIRLVKANEFLNQPAREVYPSTIDWGVKGWTFFEYESATQKIGELLMQGKF